MRKALFVFVSLTVQIIHAQAPNIQWQKSFGGSEMDLTGEIKQTNDGGYVALGSTLSDNIFSGEIYRGSYDLYVVKTSASGSVEWQKTIGGSGYDIGISIQQTTDNGYVISGYTDSTDGDIASNHGAFDCWVIKLDGDGNMQWQNTYGGSAIDQSFSIIQTPDGGYVLSGYAFSSDGQVPENQGSADAWIVKLNALGVIEWQQTLGGSSREFINAIIPTADNGYALVGHTFSNDGDVALNHGEADAWVVKLNSSGTIVWEKTFGGLANDFLFSIQQTTDGGFVASGQTESTDGFFAVNHGIYDAWIVKLTQDGILEWQKLFGSSEDDSANCILQTADGNYIFSGQTAAPDGDPIAGHGDLDVWMVKINSSGAILWQKMYGGSAYDGVTSLIHTADNGFAFLANSTSNDVDVTSNAGSGDLWLVKLTPELLNTVSFHENALLVYPNPVLSKLNLEMPYGSSIETVKIIDVTGKIVLQTKEHASQIDVQDLPSGMYMLQVFSNGQSYQTKFLKQ